MNLSIGMCVVVALAAVAPAAALAATPILMPANIELARAERVGVETPGVLRSSGSDSGLGTISVSCVETTFGQRPQVQLVRPTDPEPERIEVASMDLHDLLVPEFFDDETDGEIRDREDARVWAFPSSPGSAVAGRYELRLGLFLYSLDELYDDFQPIGSAEYQIDITCEADPT